MEIGNIPSPAKISKANTSVDMFAKLSQSTAGTAFQDMMNMSAGKSGKADDVFQKVQSESDVKDVMDKESKVDNILNDSKLQSQTDNSVSTEELDSLKKEIADAVKDVLGLTDEELEQLLAENGLTLLDLLMPQNLAALVTDVMADGDAMKLLTDSSVSDTLSELNSKLKDIMNSAAEDLDVSLEELYAAMEELRKAEGAAKDADKAASRVDMDAEAVGDGSQLEDNITVTTDKSSNEENAGQNGESLSSQFVQTLVDNVEGQMAADEVFEGYQTNAEDIVRQLIESIKVNVSETTSSMELQLYPEHLGKIQITVASKEGVITAQLAAQNEAVKAIIENQLVSLKDTMNEQGLKVDAVEVTIASHTFEDGRNFEGSNKGQTDKENQSSGVRHIRFDIPDEELTDTEQLAKQMMQANGGSVDYTA